MKNRKEIEKFMEELDKEYATVKGEQNFVRIDAMRDAIGWILGIYEKPEIY